MVVAKEAVGNLGGMVRQLSLDQFENESRRMIPMNNGLSYPTKKFTRQESPQGLHKKVNSRILTLVFRYIVINCSLVKKKGLFLRNQNLASVILLCGTSWL